MQRCRRLPSEEFWLASIGADPYLSSRSQQLGAQALRYAVAAIFETRDFVVSGGLVSYLTNGSYASASGR